MTVEELTPAQIREYGSRYGLRVTGTVGTTLTRIFALLVFLALCGVLSMFVVGLVVKTSPYFEILSLAGTVFLGGMGIVELFLIDVPKMTGLLVTNYFGGRLHAFGTGLGLKFPWEHFVLDDYLDLRAISLTKDSRFMAKFTSKTEEGQSEGAVGVTFSWTVQYGPHLPLLALYVRTEEKAIEDGFAEVVENAISEAILKKSLDELLVKETIDYLQQALIEAFQQTKDAFESTLEQRFGIHIELTTLGPPDFDKDYNEALSAQVIRGIVVSDATKMSRELEISGEKALDNIMMLNKEEVKKTIYTIQADEALKDAAKNLGEVLEAGREIAVGLGAARSGGRQQRRRRNPPQEQGGNQ